jgi:hypothetical protein
MVHKGVSHQVEYEWYNMQQSIIEVTEEMIGEINKQRNEEWYNDEYNEAIRRKMMINRDMRGGGDTKIPGIVKKII